MWGRGLLTLLIALTLSGPAGAVSAVNGKAVTIARDHFIEGRRVAIFERDWLYCYPPGGLLIIVPAGYMTDFASIPAGVPHFEPFGKHKEAAVGHDWLYAVGEPGKRAFADEVFGFALGELGTPWWERQVLFAAVRLGGGRAFGNPDEFGRRFGNAATGRPLKAWLKRPGTAIVARDVDCDRMNRVRDVHLLQEQFGSHTWPRVAPDAPAPPRPVARRSRAGAS